MKDVVKPYSYAFEGVEFHEGNIHGKLRLISLSPAATQK